MRSIAATGIALHGRKFKAVSFKVLVFLLQFQRIHRSVTFVTLRFFPRQHKEEKYHLEMSPKM